jgi:Domain of unknown function (DUF4249)
MKKQLGILIVATLLLASCLDEIKLEQPAKLEKLVIEGGITDNATENILRLSYTDGVGAPKRVLPTSGVYVEIQSSKGDKIVMRADPYGSGLFTSERGSFVGKAGELYNLYIKLSDGREYKSVPQLMPAKVPIKKLNYEVTEKPRAGFAISTDLDDPKETENYYRWKAESFKIKRTTGVPVAFSICCNTCWVKDISESLNVLSDQNFNGNTIKNHPVYFSNYTGQSMHKINIKQFGISKEAYQYYKKLKSQLGRTGSIFDPIPATVRGNIVNTQNPDDVALGFFEVSTIIKKQLEILDEKLQKYDAFYGSELYVLKGDCLLQYPYSVYFESYNQSLFN